MFTGIIEQVGEVIAVDDAREFRTIRVQTQRLMDDLSIGSSVAVNGVCLTVRSLNANTFTADLSHETLERTTLRGIRPRSLLNLERPMRADSRFGGHIVQGHVDGVGMIESFMRAGDSWDLQVRFPENAGRYIVEKGSIAVDGISLTIASLESGMFSIAIIPHTLENTNLQTAKAGDAVNLEYDVVAKYVESLIKPYAIR